VAWWGAVVATSVLIWDFYKWKTSGAKIRLLVQSRMKMFGDPSLEDDTFVMFKVTNIGSRPTTITTVGFRYYENWWRKIRKKENLTFIVPNPALNHQQLPYVLDVGQEWMGGTKQTKDIEKYANEGYLIAEIYDSVHEKPSSGRVVINK